MNDKQKWNFAKYCKYSAILKILLLTSVLSNLFVDVTATHGGGAGNESWSLQKHPRNGRLLSVWFTVSCDRRIFVRACLHFVSFGAVSRLVLFLHSLKLSLSPRAIYPVVFSYAFNPFFFFSFAALAALPRDTRRKHLACPCAWSTKRAKARTHARAWRWVLRRFNERYYDLVALDITHINPRATLILENLELSRAIATCASRQSGEFINRSRKKKTESPCAEEGWSHASGSDEPPPRREKLRNLREDLRAIRAHK